MNAPGSRQENALDDAFEKKVSRFIVGIDLGTTNCAVAYLDTHETPTPVRTLAIEQMIDIATRQSLDTLPSFHYELLPNELGVVEGRFLFGTGEHHGVVGSFSRDRGQEQPGRAISSAKSWLCNTFVDRTSDLLPWGSDDDVQRISPVEASRRYLEQIRRCWDRSHPGSPLAEQDTIVTLPASFDELARRLTIDAAEKAGIKNLYLIEEPQAAFYAWLERNASNWTDAIRPGQTILVCDIGGGTTDFTLIRVTTQKKESVRQKEKQDLSAVVEQELQGLYGLHRVAVGEHLMLGGDNLDLALAKAIEERLLAETPGIDRLKPKQWDALKLQCRVAKEKMLSDTPPAEYRFSIPGSGSRLIESNRSVTVAREFVHELLLGGFFGPVPLHSRPDEKESGFQEFGLPYASEPNVLKHLAAFLWDHRWAGRPDPQSGSDDLAARPDWVLFNGGVLESPQVKNAILDQIADWFSKVEPDWKPAVLEGNRLDLAVAQGAAYYGKVRRGDGVRIDAQLARAYYIQVSQTPPRAMCVMPANARPGDRFELSEQPLQLLLGAPVQFPMFVSSTSLLDKPGDVVQVDLARMHSAAPIHTVLQLPRKNMQRTAAAYLESQLTEIGTLQLHLKLAPDPELTAMFDRPIAWQLELDARGQGIGLSNTSAGPVVPLDADSIAKACERVLSPDGGVLPKQAWEVLAMEIGSGRREWSPNALREIWRHLILNSEYRTRSPEHESRWLNLLGWSLRPGFGMVADDWRVQETWRAVYNKLMHRTASSQSEAIVLWRRIAGGFTVGQQRALFQDIWAKLKPLFTPASGTALGNNLAIELLRLVGSLERLQPREKELIMDLISGSMTKKRLEPLIPAMLWTLGRLGTRSPVYAGHDSLVRVDKVERMLGKLMEMPAPWVETHRNHLSLCMKQCGQMTGDRHRDFGNRFRESLVEFMREHDFPTRHVDSILTVTRDEQDLESIVGDSIPLGFHLHV